MKRRSARSSPRRQPEERELFCRNGLKWFRKIPAKNIRATLKEIEKQRAILRAAGRARHSVRAVVHARGGQRTARPTLLVELDLAARMAAQSCRFMLVATSGGGWKNVEQAKQLAQAGIRELQKLEKDFNALLAFA